MPTEQLDLDRLRAWIGREEVQADIVTAQLVRAFRATFDEEPGHPALGEAAPLCLHWCLSPATAPARALGPDGHPARGGFLPPVPLPRRMWAGGRLWFSDDLRVGDRVERTSTVKDVTIKEGRTGSLCFVVVEHRLFTARGLALREEQDLVYRGLAAPPAGPGGTPAPAAAEVTRLVDPTPVLLFRYSALTFNGHRIHYDHPYATAVEGYPGLVVHGPLQATLLLRAAAALRPGERIASFAFRATRPLFDRAPFTVNAARTPDGAAAAWIGGPDHLVAMQATAAWA